MMCGQTREVVSVIYNTFNRNIMQHFSHTLATIIELQTRFFLT